MDSEEGPTRRPRIVAVDHDPATRALLAEELNDRYGRHYDIVVAPTGDEARTHLGDVAHGDVALVLADRADDGHCFLTAARSLHPHAKRVLLTGWNEHRSAREEIVAVLRRGDADYYLAKPTAPPDERFHGALSEFLGDWCRRRGGRFEAVRVIGDDHSPRAHEICDLLHRHDFPYAFHDVNSDTGRATLDAVAVTATASPVVIVHGGAVLVDPTNLDVAKALGARTRPGDGIYDVVVVGGGPAGLAAAVYAGSEGLRVALVERTSMGGQAGTSSMIRNYLGFPRGISGAELATRRLRPSSPVRDRDGLRSSSARLRTTRWMDSASDTPVAGGGGAPIAPPAHAGSTSSTSPAASDRGSRVTGRSSAATIVELDGRQVRLTNLDKVLWPSVRMTKAALIDYYVRVAPVLLPHIAGHPLTLHRFPDGVDGNHWFETRAPRHPPWVRTQPMYAFRKGKDVRAPVIDDLASLVWAANAAAIELHPFLGTTVDLLTPTAAVFDLDPGPPAGLLDAASLALEVRAELARVGLDALVKTSGAKGLHIHAPLNSPHSFAQTKALAREIARRLTARHPDRVVDVMSRARRVNKVFLDWSQNDPGKSLIAPYSLRGLSYPTAAVPLIWTEVETAVSTGHVEGLVFLADRVVDRWERLGDVFAPVLTKVQSVPAALDAT